LKTLPEKAAWNVAFEKYLHQLDERKPVIWIGDFNVVPTELDIRNWKTNYNKSAGVTDTEIEGFNKQLAGRRDSDEAGKNKFVDVWRKKNEGLVGHYTYFSYKFQCRVKGIGWRIDLVVASERILDKIGQCEIRQTICKWFPLGCFRS
jgi:AP endonuclease-1